MLAFNAFLVDPKTEWNVAMTVPAGSMSRASDFETNLISAELAKIEKDNQRRADKATSAGIVIFIVTLIVSVSSALWLSLSVTRTLKKLAKEMNRMNDFAHLQDLADAAHNIKPACFLFTTGITLQPN